MGLDTPEEIQQFLTLQKMSDNQLRNLCEGMELPSDGGRDELVTRLVNTKIVPQTDFMAPQMIALRTKIHNKEIPGAEDLMKRARKIIFDGKNNVKDFAVLNGKMESYMLGMRYAQCSKETLDLILNKGMIYPHPSQRELVRIIKKDPDVFNFCIVQRPYAKNKTFIMLHVSPKG